MKCLWIRLLDCGGCIAGIRFQFYALRRNVSKLKSPVTIISLIFVSFARPTEFPIDARTSAEEWSAKGTQ